MKIFGYVWAAICIIGFIFAVGTASENLLLALVGCIPLGITVALCVIADRLDY